ncbi:MAG: hypothetical protein AMQ74_01732 [Candidatus Methanofastidiosum methylothiophilum]|uniref:Helix-turn-helix type 11 domain-containing protein n=1 Tax=Candidatus Methanofastidiosum methylothiophilum TaxID=1705564 RepID=A0A150IPE6_9EURY|nr:MAG: hypothetical protein AMQ74_01732 [Candidatus Methanofastidiosum methylthiophilus]
MKERILAVIKEEERINLSELARLTGIPRTTLVRKIQSIEDIVTYYDGRHRMVCLKK